MVSKAKETVEDFNHASLEHKDATSSYLCNSIMRQKCPPLGVWKANCDVAINISRQLMGVGVVVRSHECAVMACMKTVKPYIRGLTLAEAIAAWVAGDKLK